MTMDKVYAVVTLIPASLQDDEANVTSEGYKMY